MIAALPMYDFQWVQQATDRLWAHVRDRLRRQGFEAPQGLAHGLSAWDSWNNGGLLLGQTCGYPYYKGLRRRVDLLGTPVYSFAGCIGTSHRSFLVAHREAKGETLADFRGLRAAVNSGDSNTGMNLFRAAVAPLAEGRPFFADIVVTGSHAMSFQAVAEGIADIAAIDCVSYALLARGASELIARTKLVGETEAAPALPFIASMGVPREIRMATRTILHELPPFQELGITSVVYLPETAYVRIEDIEREAIQAGYPRLA